MRILFALSRYTLLRHFETVVLELARRGHEVRLVLPEQDRAAELPGVFASEPRISRLTDSLGRSDDWGDVVRKIRAVRDCLLYQQKRFARASKLRKRAFRKMMAAISDDQRAHATARAPDGTKVRDDELFAMLLGGFTDDRTGAGLDAFLQSIERNVPADARVSAFLREQRPDVVVLTSLVHFGASLTDLVKSARAVGVPTVYPVFSWDNLTTKRVMHEHPDTVLVWNDWQRTEAIKVHSVPRERVHVTGAPRFDTFLELTAAQSRDAYCARYRLDPAQPIVAYLGSSDFVTGNEPEFAAEWLHQLRAQHEIGRCNVVVRPHPRAREAWQQFPGLSDPRVALDVPHGFDSDQTLRDLLEHSAAVVGLNTSAELEAGLVGRPVLTVRTDTADGQDSTIHFHYLLETQGGFVRVAPSLHEHFRQLAEAIATGGDRERIATFMERFVRPAGRHKPVTPLVADAIEAQAQRRLAAGIAADGALSGR